MKKILLITTLIFFLFSVTASFAQSLSQCNKVEARRLLDTIKKNYNLEYDDYSNILYVDMKEGWYSMNIDTKHRFLRMIANLDACIHGKARHIYIYAWGEKVAEATPMGGFKVFK